MSTDILLVDDDEDLRFALAQLLLDEGYAVEELSHADTLIEVIETRRPGLVLLDLSMENFDVAATGRLLAEKGLMEWSRIIVLSGREDAAQITQEHGFHGTLPKPFELDRLLELVEAALARRRTQEKAHHDDPLHP